MKKWYFYGIIFSDSFYDCQSCCKNHRFHNLRKGSYEEIDRLLVLDMKEHDYFTRQNMSNEHGEGNLFACDKEIMGWLFSNGNSH